MVPVDHQTLYVRHQPHCAQPDIDTCLHARGRVLMGEGAALHHTLYHFAVSRLHQVSDLFSTI